MTGARVVDPVAHELYLKGLHHYYKWQPADFELAIRYFTQATQVDPRFAPAWIGLANSYGFLWIWGKLSLQEGLPKYNEAIRRALEIDEALPEAHYALAAAAFYYRWDWHEAEREFERALELNPNLVEARFEYAYFLAAMGRHLEAIEEAKRAVRTDPLSIPANLALADVYFLARQDERAKAQVLEARDLEPADPKPYRWLASYAEGTGDVGEAVRLSQKAMALSGAPAAEVTAMIQAYERSGAEGYYRWKLRRSSDPVGMAACYLELHDIDSALASLEKAYQAHNWALNGLETKRVWDPLRSDPRFQDLVRRVGLP
jgi:tetratricopeptide (TPR) repeat protein